MKLNLTHRAFLTGAALLAGSWACVAANRPAPAQTPAPAVLTPCRTSSAARWRRCPPPIPRPIHQLYGFRPAAREVSGSNGALLSSTADRARWLEVQSRVGTYQLDETHKLGDRPPSWTSPGTNVPIDDDISILRREIWRETDRQYRAAAQALIKVKTSRASAGSDRRRRRSGFFARAAATRLLVRASKSMWTANPGKSACGDTRPSSASHLLC